VSHLFAKADAAAIPLPDQSVDLVFGSPPYTDARLYLEAGIDLGISRDTDGWVAWMLAATEEALRVSRGCVVWIAWGPTRDRNYQPACEGLMWEWFKRGGSAYRPCFWHRVGISGSGGDQWFRADVEYAMCFKRSGPLPWTDNTAMGHPPKWAPGGEMSHRMSDGTRCNQWGGHENQSDRGPDGVLKKRTVKPSHRIETRAEAGGRRKAAVAQGLGKTMSPRDSSVWAEGDERGEWNYVPPAIANPGCLIKTTTGGGQLGWDGAHENEAPFPAELAEWFVRSLCPPGGTVLDPFSGSGTTVSVANAHGRHGIGLDLRMSQCRLGTRRLERPHQIVPRVQKAEHFPLFD